MARTGLKNKQNMKYSLYLEKIPVYATDDDGNILYDNDGDLVETGDYVNGYAEPIDFMANMVFSSGEAEATAYGVTVSDYDSKIVCAKGYIPITETSLIFTDSEPDYNSNGTVKDKSADFRVVKVQPSLNYMVYLLKRIEK